MDDLENWAIEHGVDWATWMSKHCDPANDAWPGSIEDARAMVDEVARGRVPRGQREMLATIVFARAIWAWRQFRRARLGL